MNNSFHLLIALSAIVLTSANIAAEPVPEEAQSLISDTVEETVPHLMAAIELATGSGTREKNFATLATQLTRFGFGQPPVAPPWMRPAVEDAGDLSDDDRLAAEDRRKEAAERIKRLGQEDIAYLKAIDANGDLSTNPDEISTAIRQKLEAELLDKLNVDKNGDQKLTLQEYALAVPAKGETDEEGIDWHQRGHFNHDDQNSDGFLDIREMMGHDTRAIAGRALLMHLVFLLPDADSDGDGKISEAEFSSLSDAASDVWEKASPDGSPLEISRAYPTLYWVPNDSISTLLPQ